GIEGYLTNSIESAVAAIVNLPNINRRKCRQRVEECFSADVIVDRYEKLYQTILRKRESIIK
ncbi:MAG: glycosyltransferase family 4 protein, partial [Cyanobacteria bacterium J06643_5]